MKGLLLVALLGFLMNDVNAWWRLGHRISNFTTNMGIAFEIARQQLMNESKGEILNTLDGILLNMTENDAGKTMDMLPNWMDQIMDDGGMKWSGIFHYVQVPFIAEPGNYSIYTQANASGALVFSYNLILL